MLQQDLSDHKLDPAEFPHLDLTATVRRTDHDGSPVNIPLYVAACLADNRIGAGVVGSLKIIPPITRAEEPAEPKPTAVADMPYRNVPLIR